jgi:hypothetical protein
MEMKFKSRKIRYWWLSFFIWNIFIVFFWQFWGIIGVLIAIPVAILTNMIIGSIQGVKCWNQCSKDYNALCRDGMGHEDAMIEISKSFYSDVDLDTHKKIISKFNNIDLLVNFYTGALPETRHSDSEILLYLKHTFINKLPSGQYRVKTDRSAMAANGKVSK